MKNQSIRYYETCPKCQECFTVQNIKRHIKTCKGQGNKYKVLEVCPYCRSYKASTQKAYRDHLKECKGILYRSKDKTGKVTKLIGNFNCRFCNQEIKDTLSALRLHERFCTQNPNRHYSHWLGKKHKVESKIKIAQSVRNRLGNEFRGFYNKKACEFIENLNKEKGFHFQHQLNGGEFQVGPYFLDGYDKENNIVFEFNEKGHYKNLKKIGKDEYRRNYILERLNCKFFVFNTKEQQFEEYNKIGLIRTFKSLNEW